jgi:hypothetical protein
MIRPPYTSTSEVTVYTVEQLPTALRTFAALSLQNAPRDGVGGEWNRGRAAALDVAAILVETGRIDRVLAGTRPDYAPATSFGQGALEGHEEAQRLTEAALRAAEG